MIRWMLMGLLAGAGTVLATDQDVLDRWIERQASIRTLSAEFTQTRSLPVLRVPVSAEGRLWFSAPGKFRWEIGSPAKTILLRDGEKVSLIDPRKKTIRVDAEDAGRREAGLMDFPFVRSREDLERRFEIKELRVGETECRLRLVPRDTRGFLTAVEVVFQKEAGHLVSLEMKFRDGSSMRNEFRHVRVNEKLPAGIFVVDETGYQVLHADG